MQKRQARQAPSVGAAVLLFLLVGVLNVGLALLFDAMELSENVMLLSTPALVLLLTLSAAFYLRVDLKTTLLLKLPSGSDLFMAFPLAISFFILGDQLSLLTEELFPIPEEITEGTRRMMQAQTPADWFVRIASIGVGAAVSEELMFRGFVQTAFLGSMSRTAAVLWSSFLFMLIHFLPIPAIAAAGVVLGFVALATGSIVVPIIVHFTNNFAGLLLVNLADLDTLGEPLWIPPTILLPALAIFALTTGYYLRRLPPPERSPREQQSEGPQRLPLAPRSVSLSEELAAVPRERRRLGWLAVAASLLLGLTVLFTMFAISVYSMYPQQTHERVIEVLRQESERQLAPSASENASRVMAAFDALSAVNETGNLGWRDLMEVFRIYAALAADGVLDVADTDALVDGIQEVVLDATRPRRL